MRQIIKSLASVRHSVSLSVNIPTAASRNFDSILMTFWTVILGPKSKIEFVWYKNLITFPPILPQFLKICITAYGDSKWYNLVPVEDNCALCLPPSIFGVRQSNSHFNLPPDDPHCHSNHSQVAKLFIATNGDFKAV